MFTTDRNSCVDAKCSAVTGRALRELLCLLLGFLCWTGVEAKLYRCQDASGQWAFQDRPCPEGTERKEVRPRNLAPKGPPQLRPKPKVAPQCTVRSEPFRFEHEDLFGIEGRFVLERDGQSYQLSVQLSGDWVNANLDPVPLALSARLNEQGVLVGQRPLQGADWLLELRRFGFGQSRSAAILDAQDEGDLVVTIWIRGRQQMDWSLPLAGDTLRKLKATAETCTEPTLPAETKNAP